MGIERLLSIMARLRDPEHGCPWDLEQDFRSIAPHTIEEAYEVADAIERGDLRALRDELGDLLFQVAFHARLADEQGAFQFGNVVDSICDKLTRRHPHVFCDAVITDAGEQTRAWERMKREERAARGEDGALADVPIALPRPDARPETRVARRTGGLRLARRNRPARQGFRGTRGARPCDRFRRCRRA
jgi:ATP diphosphatase